MVASYTSGLIHDCPNSIIPESFIIWAKDIESNYRLK